MSYVIAAPEMMTAAATDLAGIGSDLTAAHTAAATATVWLVPAAADEVSAGVAHLFSRYAEDFHGLAAQAAAFQEQFVQHLTASAFSYAGIEAAIASFLQTLTAIANRSVGNWTAEVNRFIGHVTTTPPEQLAFNFLYDAFWLLTLPVTLPLELLIFYILGDT
jgi:hypothetical protein